MDIHIKYEDDTMDIILPINPSSVIVSNSNNDKTVTIHNLGDINLKGKRGLWGLTLESYFPGNDDQYGYEHGSFNDPYDYYIKELRTLFENNDTVHVIVTETDINMFCTISTFSYGNQERNNDVSYTLGFTEYREISMDKVTSKRSGKKKKKTAKTWKKGDTWQKLTKTVLGSSSEWKRVRSDNANIVKAAKKKNPGKKEKEALVGSKVVISP